MAVVYFTSNASTGAGSLAEAVENALPGDVVRPDETVFERGSTIEIALASTITIDKNLTLDASPFRVRLDGGGAFSCAAIATAVNAGFTAFDFIGGVTSQNGGGLRVERGANAVLSRCRVCGCDAAQSGGGIYIGDAATLTASDSAIFGNRARFGGGVYVGDDATATFSGATVCGNVDANAGLDIDGETSTSALAFVNSILGNAFDDSETSGSVVDVAPSAVGFVASPPDDLTPENWNANAWQDWDLRLLDDASGAPSPYRDSGDVGAMSRYDLDGNFRGRETNGVATCSPGAFETIQADLFWVGHDATGAEVVSPSFLTSNGWAASRFATVSGDVAPQAGKTLFIDGVVVFSDDLPTFSARRASVVVGGFAKVDFNAANNVGLALFSVGYGSLTTANTSLVMSYSAARVAAWARLTGQIVASIPCEFNANAYVASGYFYNSFVSPSPTYGVLVVAPSAPTSNVRFEGVYACDAFRTTAEGTSPTRTIKIGDAATIRARSVSFAASAEAPFETLFDKRVAIELQGAASATVGDGAPSSWADAFEIDVSDATAANLKLNGQTVYGDAPTCAVALTGSARIGERGLTSQSLTLNADSTLTVDGAKVSVGALTVADGATVAFSGVNAVLAATDTSTVGTATFIGTGYFATPPGTDTSSASFAETVRNCDYGANVSSFSASPNTTTTAILSWVKQDLTPSVLIEEANGSAWNVVNNRATGDSLSVDISDPKTFRLFDGENFFTASVRPYGTAYELAEEQTIGYLKTLISTGYLN